jgi:hypothetical protein
MSDSINQASKIKAWLKKTYLSYALWQDPNRFKDALKAAQIELDGTIPIIINLLATETNPKLLSKVVWAVVCSPITRPQKRRRNEVK